MLPVEETAMLTPSVNCEIARAARWRPPSPDFGVKPDGTWM